MTRDDFEKACEGAPNPGSDYDETLEPDGSVIIEINGAWTLADLRDRLAPFVDYWVEKGRET